MTKLYELTTELNELSHLAFEVEDDQSFALAIADTMEALQMQFNDKAEALVKVAETLGANTTAIDAEIKRLQARKKTIVNRQTALKDYLRNNMEASEITKIESPLFTISLVKGRAICEVTDEAALPDEYMSVKTEIKPDKAALTKALKDGLEIAGARLTTSKPSLRIK
ncbi:siphovirus Gp157 family protein [Thiomicrorhabdus sp. 6S2-11]|uniref:Siphovirus Gp157 family protein n=1 Tax=Thiomicrorhabdus marina TaxID=2818442 RepID=A0ABS3Q2X9_9GAMM|nr:siphovirus Gp157 family protein [Thiomicrorhabdus marina]MBO1926672.1 siphovirus Gp157 family protein [Thiomicrorhabdus marina]